MNTWRMMVFVAMVGVLCGTPAFGQTPEELMAIRAEADAALNAHDLESWLSYWAEDGVLDWVAESTQYAGKEQIGRYFQANLQGSPDLYTTEARVLAVDNYVVVEHAIGGTNTGELGGNPPTGNAWIFPHVDIYEFEGTKIQRLTTYGDNGGFYAQLGVLPTPEIPELVPSMALPDPEPTGLSPLEAHAEHIRRWSSRDATGMAQIYHADCKIFAGPLSMELDRAAMMAVNEMYFSAFPNAELKVVRTIELSNSWVLTEFVSHSIHQQAFFGFPASGYPTEIRLVWLTRYTADGLVSEGGFYYDNLTLINQMTTAPEYSPVGNWVTSLPSPFGNIVFTHTVSPQERPGGAFSGVMKQVNSNPTSFGMFPEAESGSDWVTHTVWAGRDRLKTTALAYSTKMGEGPVAEIVSISIAHVDWTLTGPDTNEGNAVQSIYLPEQDADGDGFPDEGEAPVNCMPFTFTSRRLAMWPPCVPVPMADEATP